MTVTFTNLSGTRENLDKTIKTLLSSKWDNSNTSSITPTFESDTEEPDQLARPDESTLNAVRVNFASRERERDQELDWNGDDKHLWKCRLFIECQAESLSLMTLFEDEVNRILWENAPNSATRLNKSGGSASEAAWFEDSEVEFERLEPDPESEDDQSPSSQGELLIYYYKIRT